jgi:NAD(P)-dependent dehydrogenase (short-subunit alcohol dehydrogenase family)
MSVAPADLFDLTGRVALVTGASSGLGVEFALSLRAAGATVAIAARRTERLDDLASEHPGLHAVQCDVADEESVCSSVARVVANLGTIDVLVNNAGITSYGPGESESVADLRRVLEVNLVGAFAFCQQVGRVMLAQGSGSIVNISSILGSVASAPIPASAYCASKGALTQLTRELAVQWAGRGVRVNALAPGYFPSEAASPLLDSDFGEKHVTRNTPAGRPGRAGELNGALLLLASDAGSYINGQILHVDGGWTAR